MGEFGVEGWVIIIGAIGLVINNAISNWKMSAKVEAINATAKVIEGHVNSASTKADERARAGEARERELEKTIDGLRKTAELLAQAAAIREANSNPISTGPVTITDSESIPAHDVKKLAAKLEIKPKKGSTGE